MAILRFMKDIPIPEGMENKKVRERREREGKEDRKGDEMEKSLMKQIHLVGRQTQSS